MSSRTVSTPRVFWAVCFDVFCAEMDAKMRQQKSKWNKMGSCFLVCWLVCLFLCLFVWLYCFFWFLLAQSCVCSLLFVLWLFWGCLTDYILIMLVHWISCIVILYCLFGYKPFGLFACQVCFLACVWFLDSWTSWLFVGIFRRVGYKCPPNSNNEGRTNAATFWSVRWAHERWAP